MECPLPPKQLSEQARKELKEIAFAELGIHMSDDQVEEMGIRLLSLIVLLAQKPK